MIVIVMRRMIVKMTNATMTNDRDVQLSASARLPRRVATPKLTATGFQSQKLGDPQNKLAKLEDAFSRVHLQKIHFGKIHPDKFSR